MTELEIKTTSKIYERFNEILLPKRGTSERELSKMQKEYEKTIDKQWISKESLIKVIRELDQNIMHIDYFYKDRLTILKFYKELEKNE